MIIMWARRHGQDWALSPSGNVVKCFVHCKTLSRRIIYALFLQPIVGFWRLRPQTTPGLHPWTPLGDFRPHTTNLPIPGKKLYERPWWYYPTQRARRESILHNLPVSVALTQLQNSRWKHSLCLYNACHHQCLSPQCQCKQVKR